MNLGQIIVNVITILIGEKVDDSSHTKHLHGHLQKHVIPIDYDIKLNLILDNYKFNKINISNVRDKYDSFLFYGESSIIIKILNSTQNIKLHTLNLIINQIETKLINTNGTIYELKSFTYYSVAQILDLHFIDLISPGNYTLKTEFIGQTTHDDEELFFTSPHTNKDGNTASVATYQFIHAIGGRRLFPCWDVPHLKARFTITIKHRHNFTVSSYMPIRDSEFDYNELMWTYFYTTPLISTYQGPIILTNFNRIRINGTRANVSLWHPESLSPQTIKFVQQIIENVTRDLKFKLTEIETPRMDHIVIPHFSFDETLELGLIFHRESDLVYHEHLDSFMRKIEIANLIAIKITHQWLNNMFMPPFLNSWLHDAFAILYGEGAVVKIFSENNSQLEDLFIIQNQYESLRLDSFTSNLNSNISRNDTVHNGTIYNYVKGMKALNILRMLQNKLKINDTEYATWCTFNNYPIITWQRNKTSDSYFYEIMVNFNTTSTKKNVSINLILRSVQHDTFSNIKIQLLPEETLPKKYDRNDSIIFEPTGYYRVRYYEEDLKQLAHYLNSDAGGYKNISVVNRARIIDDAFYFVMTGQLNAFYFWELTKYLSRETNNYAAWYPMFKILECISSIFPIPYNNIHFNSIKNKLRDLLSKFIERLGSFDEHPMEYDLTDYLRHEVIKWACILEHPECLRIAHFKLEQHLQDPKSYKILPQWRKWIYCNGFVRLNTTSLPRKLIESISTNIKYIVCIQNYESITNVLMSNNYFHSRRNSPKKDIIHDIIIFYNIIEKYTTNWNFLRQILAHLPDMKPRKISLPAAYIYIINHMYNTFEVERIYITLKSQNLVKLQHILPAIENKIRQRWSQIIEHTEYFRVLLRTKSGDWDTTRPSASNITYM